MISILFVVIVEILFSWLQGLDQPLQENTQHSDGHSDGKYFRRFSLTTFRRNTDESKVVGNIRQNSDRIL